MYEFDDTYTERLASYTDQTVTENWDADDKTEKTGTTTVAVTYADGVVVAADRQTTAGSTAVSRNSVKISQIHPTAVLTSSGLVGDTQRLTDVLESRASMFEVQRGRQMSIRQLVSVASNILYDDIKLVAPILAGVDDEGGHVFTLDPFGSIGEGQYKATGSGRTHAYGVLDDRYEDALTHSEAKELVRDAVVAAHERDVFTGYGLVVATITDDVTIEEYEGMPAVDKL